MGEPASPAASVLEVRSDARAEHRHGQSVRLEGARVRRAVDALRQARDHDDARPGTRSRELSRDSRAVWSHATRADDAHGARSQNVALAIDPQRIGWRAKIE